MVVYLRSREGLLWNAFSQGFNKGLQLALEEWLKRQEEERRAQRAREIASRLSEALNISPIRTYTVGGFQPDMQELEDSATTNITPYDWKQINSPLQFVEIFKSPHEYTKDIYTKTAPIMAEATAYGLNLFPIVNQIVKSYLQDYQIMEEEKQKLAEQKQQQKLLERRYKYAKSILKTVAKRHGFKLTPKEEEGWALAIATGEVKPTDFTKIIRGQYVYKNIPMDDGRQIVIIYDKNTGEEKKRFTIWPDQRLKAKEIELRESIKAKYSKGKKRSWKIIKKQEPLTFDEWVSRYYPEGIKSEEDLKDAETTYQMLLQSGAIPKKTVYFKVYEDTNRAEPIQIEEEQQIDTTINPFARFEKWGR